MRLVCLLALLLSAPLAGAADLDLDGIDAADDLCPFFPDPAQTDTDLDGRGDACECGDQDGDGRNTAADLVAINVAIFNPALATPLCDGNGDGLCNVWDIVAANVEIFSPTNTSTCERQPLPGISASFDAPSARLTITGDGQGNSIVISRTVGGAILVNAGAVAIAGGTPSVANTLSVRVLGRRGNDVIGGQVGFDTLRFNGSDANEAIALSPSGTRLWLVHDVAAVTLDAAGIEMVQVSTAGGADRLTVDDLTGLDVTEVKVDLSAAAGSPTGDSQADDVVIQATGSDDVVIVSAEASGLTVVGLASAVSVAGSDAALDRLRINLLAGDDTLEASALPAGWINLICDGGPQADALIGSAGDDVLLGGEGDDVLLGGPGVDALDGGPGDDVVIQG